MSAKYWLEVTLCSMFNRHTHVSILSFLFLINKTLICFIFLQIFLGLPRVREPHSGNECNYTCYLGLTTHLFFLTTSHKLIIALCKNWRINTFDIFIPHTIQPTDGECESRIRCQHHWRRSLNTEPYFF